MPGLTPALLRSRLAFDWRVMREMTWTEECSVTGYTSGEAAQRGRAATDAEGKAGLVTVYEADFRFRMLSSQTQRLDHARIRMDLLAGRRYPHTAPLTQVLTRPLPYSTHVEPVTGIVCVGEGWPKAKGQILAAQLVVHCMRCFNYDEPDRGKGYHGYIPEAHRFWRKVLGSKPLNPFLTYPTLPLHLTHGIVDAAILFEDIPTFGAAPEFCFEDAPASEPFFDAAWDGAQPLTFSEVP